MSFKARFTWAIAVTTVITSSKLERLVYIFRLLVLSLQLLFGC